MYTEKEESERKRNNKRMVRFLYFQSTFTSQKELNIFSTISCTRLCTSQRKLGIRPSLLNGDSRRTRVLPIPLHALTEYSRPGLLFELDQQTETYKLFVYN